MVQRAGDEGVVRVLPLIAAASLLGAALLVHGCKDIVAETLQPVAPDAGTPPGQIGDLCDPSFDRFDPTFTGYGVAEINIDSDFAGCASGVCLANHFQGRVTCPLGQPAPVPCLGPDDPSCAGGTACVPSAPLPVFCDPLQTPTSCASGVCDASTRSCQCASDADCPDGTRCDAPSKSCVTYVCEPPAAGCQSAGASDADNAGKACCLSGTSAPVSAEVCGQCAEGSGRAAAEAVYCSCRCGLADGDPTPDAGPFCACPDGFSCTELEPYVGLGDEGTTGKYCMKQGTAYTAPAQCGQVRGYFDPAACSGSAGPGN